MGKTKLTTEHLETLRLKTFFDINTPDDDEHICLSIVNSNNDVSNIASLGNISVITGKPKSRKTYLVSAIIGAVLSNKTFLNFNANLPPDKNKVILFDTEQGKKDSKRIYKRILKIADLEAKENNINFEFYRLRGIPPGEATNLIEHIIYNSPNIGFVIIDGIKDLIYSINDEVEATKICGNLLKWSEELKIHILSVLHQNKTDNQTRGHIGTEIQNKAETIISIKRDENNKSVSIIESVLMRSHDFENFAISIDENDIPYLVDGFNIKENKKGLKADDIPFITHYSDILKPIFDQKDSYKYSGLWKAIKERFSLYSNTIGNNKAMQLLTFYSDHELIKKIGDTYYINNDYRFN